MSNPTANEPGDAPTAEAILVPASLRTWFRAHFVIDLVAGIPLLLFPGRSLGLLGWTTIDPVTTRLCGAALLGIGGASVLVERYGLAGYRALLALKVIWSAAAIFALLAGIAEGAPPAAWAFLSIFIAFSGVWMSYAVRLRQLERFAELDNGDTGSNDQSNDQSNDEEEADATHPTGDSA